MPLNKSRERPAHNGTGGVLVLLMLALCINYIDRTNLSLAAPILKEELHISPTQLGTLLSAFFWAYTLLQIPCGWLVDHIEVKWVLAVGFFVWTAATAMTGVLHGFVALVTVRVALGIGESVAVPCCTKLIAVGFPEKQRGFANSIVLTGLSFGPFLGIVIGGTAIQHFGWRLFFLALGVVGILWLLAWLAWMPRRFSSSVSETVSPFGFRQILLCRSAWGTFISQFAYNYCSYLLITWLPFYLVRGRNFSSSKMTAIAATVFLLSACSAAFWGRLSDGLIARGSSPTRVRKGVFILGQIGLAVFFAASALVPDTLCPWTLALVGLSLGCSVSNMWAIMQRLAGPQLSGRWMGLQNFFGNFAGLVAPALTGFLLDRTGGFLWPLFVTSMVACAGALSVAYVIGPLEQIVWTRSLNERGSVLPASREAPYSP